MALQEPLSAVFAIGSPRRYAPRDDASGGRELCDTNKRELLLGKSRQMFNQPAKIAGSQKQHSVVLAQLSADF